MDQTPKLGGGNGRRKATQQRRREMRAKIWTGDGSMIDGSEYDSREDAVEALRVWRGWDKVYEAEHCDGSAVSCYASEEDADADTDGAYADTVRDIEEGE
jgi:hypothetical protein